MAKFGKFGRSLSILGQPHRRARLSSPKRFGDSTTGSASLSATRFDVLECDLPFLISLDLLQI
ncbi:hypothetical protein H5410_027303 [Solanum commersonii]|uniref:Uncharacterized protein n=1 Tax=Solanum commersonii TaxID=4109 RepID=A0A9J5YYQ4_SOLCO|nr:hypothetical protein H5410_027303 [Solanum commersonii]